MLQGRFCRFYSGVRPSYILNTALVCMFSSQMWWGIPLMNGRNSTGADFRHSDVTLIDSLSLMSFFWPGEGQVFHEHCSEVRERFSSVRLDWSLTNCCVHLLATIEAEFIGPYGGVKVVKHVLNINTRSYGMTHSLKNCKFEINQSSTNVQSKIFTS